MGMPAICAAQMERWIICTDIISLADQIEDGLKSMD